MNLMAEITKFREQRRQSNPAELAKACCDLAKRLEKVGKYNEAYEVLSEFWPAPDALPNVDELDDFMQAEVLLRAGALAGWLGSADQATGRQELAKNLITRSIELFEKTGDGKKAAEAQGDLALCYWREGAFDEARIHLKEGLSRLGHDDVGLRAILLIRAGIVEVSARRLNEALRLYNEAAPLVEETDDHALKGSFHTQYGLLFRRLAAPENREDYLDRALIEYAAASFHFEQAGNERSLARVENNLGYLFYKVGRYKEAHRHLDRARHLFQTLKDTGTVAKVDETRARILLAEGRPAEAERIIRQAVRTLERGGEQAVLAEALTTYGVVLARLGRHARSRELLGQAMEVAETAGDLEGSGRAKLSIIEELTDQTSASELASDYQAAVELLRQTEDPATTRRLIVCGVRVIETLTAPVSETAVDISSWDGFSFKREVLKVEKSLIERALREAGGSVTKASRLLGFRHHQSLIALINSRHKDLLGTRSAVRKRRQHLFSKPRKIKPKSPGTSRETPNPAQAESAADAAVSLAE